MARRRKSTAPEQILPDGLDELRQHLGLKDIMRLIEVTARWVDPQTFELLPVWAPEHARKNQLYNANWTVARENRNRRTGVSSLKIEGNTQANKALTEALDLHVRANWSCCHIWRVDDPSNQAHNAVVQDHRFFSCVANMVLLPTPLKAFTDAMPDVKAMLRICAMNTFDWTCDHESVASSAKEVRGWRTWDAYPSSWPRRMGEKLPLGVVPINDRIRRNAERRIARIRDELKTAGSQYPRKEVRAALHYWGVDIVRWASGA
jgi:hypothetical protein